MPLERISARDAIGRLKSEGPRVVWPDHREPEKRLDGLVTVSTRPTFEIHREDKIFTMGSCFARNIERRLGEIGFTMPMFDARLEADLDILGHTPAFLNKYNTASMRAEVEWACGLSQASDEQTLLQLPDGTFHDMFSTLDRRTPRSLEESRAARKLITDRAAEISGCRIVVMTLGMAEVWRDTRSGLRINAVPPNSALIAEPDRFVLEVLSYQDILDDMEAIHAALSERGHPNFKMLVTVSPVPLRMTFRALDVITANSYSKSVQRAALEEFVLKHENVDYFPSFEPVSLTDRRIAYDGDNRHVQFSVTSRIVDRFISLYAPGVIFDSTAVPLSPSTGIETAVDLIVSAKMHTKEKLYHEAVLLYEQLFARDLNDDKSLKLRKTNLPLIRLRYSACLGKIGDKEGAKRELGLVVAAADAPPELLLRAADFYLGHGMPQAAHTTLELAESRGAAADEVAKRRANFMEVAPVDSVTFS